MGFRGPSFRHMPEAVPDVHFLGYLVGDYQIQFSISVADQQTAAVRITSVQQLTAPSLVESAK